MGSPSQRAYKAQIASQRHLFLHHLTFRLQHQRWFRLQRSHVLVADFEINTDGQRIGLFAELIWLLYALWYAGSIGAKPYARVTSSVYSRAGDSETDYLQQFFDPQWPGVALRNSSVIRKRISLLRQLPSLDVRTQGMNLWRANALVRTYLPMKQVLIDEASGFVSQNLGADYLAVHWRGTDKHLEAAPVTVSTMTRQVQIVYASLRIKPSHLFVASDELNLIEQLAQSLGRVIPELQCVWKSQIMRSHDSSPICATILLLSNAISSVRMHLSMH